MAIRSSKSLSLSRRALFQGSGAAAASAGQNYSVGGDHRFEAWESERVELEGLIDRTPETEAPRRKRLLNRCFELETLIFATPCLELPAIRVKARLLLWLMGMEMADGDGLAVMREIHAYLMR
jgi:hypothetical protein